MYASLRPSTKDGLACVWPCTGCGFGSCVCVCVCAREKTMCMLHAFTEYEDEREERGPFLYTHHEPIEFLGQRRGKE